jgi:hypothetical protein
MKKTMTMGNFLLILNSHLKWINIIFKISSVHTTLLFQVIPEISGRRTDADATSRAELNRNFGGYLYEY